MPSVASRLGSQRQPTLRKLARAKIGYQSELVGQTGNGTLSTAGTQTALSVLGIQNLRAFKARATKYDIYVQASGSSGGAQGYASSYRLPNGRGGQGGTPHGSMYGYMQNLTTDLNNISVTLGDIGGLNGENSGGTAAGSFSGGDQGGNPGGKAYDSYVTGITGFIVPAARAGGGGGGYAPADDGQPQNWYNGGPSGDPGQPGFQPQKSGTTLNFPAYYGGVGGTSRGPNGWGGYSYSLEYGNYPGCYMRDKSYGCYGGTRYELCYPRNSRLTTRGYKAAPDPSTLSNIVVSASLVLNSPHYAQRPPTPVNSPWNQSVGINSPGAGGTGHIADTTTTRSTAQQAARYGKLGRISIVPRIKL